MEVFGAKKLEKNNGEKIFDLHRFILSESTFCYFKNREFPKTIFFKNKLFMKIFQTFFVIFDCSDSRQTI